MVKPFRILLKQEMMGDSGVSWSKLPLALKTTTPVPHHSHFYRPDDLPAAQPTASKH